jgi:uncharacterized MAPEG superfamily protein
MSSELFWLMLTAILASSLCVNTGPAAPQGTPNSFLVPPDPLKERPWVARSYRAHQNLIEQLVPFAAMVMIAHAVGVSTPVTVWCAVLFFWLRVAHAIGMITGTARMPARPLIFTAGWLVTMVYAGAVLSAG